MLSTQDNELLTRSGPDAAMGQLLRRYWMPVLLSRELPEPDGPPKKVRLLNEDLLAFRDSEGKVGLIDPVCPHRGANLYFGRNEKCGLRCVFHGLKFDVNGHCVDIPIAPPGTNKERLNIKAYPTREWGDIIWAYMGPKDAMPELPMMEFALAPPSHRYVSKKWQDCNWVQCLEGAIDTAHFSFLHMVIADTDEQAYAMLSHAAIGAQGAKNDRIRWVKDDPIPQFEVLPTRAGLTIGGARRADEDQRYWRIAQYLLPNHALVPSAFPGENYHGQTWLPVSDGSCWTFTYTWNPDRPLTDDEIASCKRGHTVHAEVDENFIPLRTLGNEYLLDREEQRLRSYTGIQGVSEQDAAIQDSQGATADRTREHLFPTDIGVVRFRRQLLGAAKDLRDNNTAPESASNAHCYALRSGGWIAPAGRALKDVMVERFGHAEGYVGALYDLPESMPSGGA